MQWDDSTGSEQKKRTAEFNDVKPSFPSIMTSNDKHVASGLNIIYKDDVEDKFKDVFEDKFQHKRKKRNPNAIDFEKVAKK